MSWDIAIQRFKRQYATVEEIPDDEECLPLGLRSEVQAAISRFFSGTDWSDPVWGVYDSPAGSIEFNLGNSASNNGFMLHVRASDQVIPLILTLCTNKHWQALDCGSGTFLEQSSNPSAGLLVWAAYRNRVVDGLY